MVEGHGGNEAQDSARNTVHVSTCNRQEFGFADDPTNITPVSPSPKWLSATDVAADVAEGGARSSPSHEQVPLTPVNLGCSPGLNHARN